MSEANRKPTKAKQTMSRPKSYKETDVWNEALDRIRYIYDSFDKVVVSFSGGKDSTAVLNATIAVAREKGKLPVEAVFFDEEAIHPPTIEYVERVSKNPDVKLKWFCLEVKHRNACSNEEPFWYTWEKGKEDKWVRPMPEGAITEHPRFKKGMSFQDFAPYIYNRADGRVAMLVGIRTEESLRRLRTIVSKKEEAFLSSNSANGNNQYRCFPIYDWLSTDVWAAVRKFGWDYNRTYDIYDKTDMFGKYLAQRVCPPYGEEPLRGLYLYAECFPEMWHKMIDRVQGAATAWRYGNTELYSNTKTKPEGMKWSEYLHIILDSYELDAREAVKHTISHYIYQHRQHTKQPIPEEEAHPLTGKSWKGMCRVAIRGDFKERQKDYFFTEALKQQKKLGINWQKAQELYS